MVKGVIVRFLALVLLSLAFWLVVSVVRNPTAPRPCWYDCPNGIWCVSQGCDEGIPVRRGQ